MNTFLPYPNFSHSAQVLDTKRLGKQRVECLQILQTLAKGPFTCRHCKCTTSGSYAPDFCTSSTVHYWIKTPWYNHPAVRMWKGYENALVDYGMVICIEWIQRDNKDTCADKILEFGDDKDMIRPPWLGNEAFHASHRSNLLRKDFTYYSQFGWTEQNNLPYIWPSKLK